MLISLGVIVFWILPLLVALWILWSAYLEFRRDRIPILLYHRFISKEAAEKGNIRDDEMIHVCYDVTFAEQMKYLHDNGYVTLDFDDYVDIRSKKKQLPKKPVLINFDDGCLSNYEIAFPTLKKYGHKATIFIALEPNEYSYKCVEGVDEFLNSEQIREMAENNISIQSHTMTHCVLRDLDDETALYELTEPIRRIPEITQRPVRHIAIPRIGYSRKIKKLVRQAGYQTACCNNKGSTTGLSAPLALPRIVIERDMSIEDFGRCLRPGYSLVLRIIGDIKRIPERIGGPRFASFVRNLLYKGPFGTVFQTRNLKLAMVMLALLYLAGVIIFTCDVIAH
ncbi:MAG: polysaccharide deacetylase family protein [Desulfobacteraceae bacterium]|nr:polysaccharide deacetylase family protein [Desulfobacteraceae bacterium]